MTEEVNGIFKIRDLGKIHTVGSDVNITTDVTFNVDTKCINSFVLVQ